MPGWFCRGLIPHTLGQLSLLYKFSNTFYMLESLFKKNPHYVSDLIVNDDYMATLFSAFPKLSFGPIMVF